MSAFSVSPRDLARLLVRRVREALQRRRARRLVEELLRSRELATLAYRASIELAEKLKRDNQVDP